MKSSSPTKYGVIVLGDQDTGRQADVLVATAAKHRAVVTEIHTFDPRLARSHDDLTEIDVITTALNHAIATSTPIWIPFPMDDFGREQHLRRISLVLQRHGTNLLLGQHLWPCPINGGVNEVDIALRREVRAVDELDHAVLAAGAFTTLGLGQEIEQALTTAVTETGDTSPAHPGHGGSRSGTAANLVDELADAFGPGPELPEPDLIWSRRHYALRTYVSWLVMSCGLSQAAAATLVNAAGHRTPQGREWRQPTISALINGRYRTTG